MLTRDILAKSKNNQEPTLKPVINKEMPNQAYYILWEKHDDQQFGCRNVNFLKNFPQSGKVSL